MILFEFEGKKLLALAGINTPKSQLIDSIASLKNDKEEILKQASRLGAPRLRKVQDGKKVVLKAQVLSGKRSDVGGILMVNELEAVSSQLTDMFNKRINGEKVEKVLMEEKVDIEKEFYVSISYDSDYRSPVLSISNSGGSGIEDRGVSLYPIDILENEKILKQVQSDNWEIPGEIIQKLINLFFDQDHLLLEVNPLVKTKSGEWVALDAKIKLDDDAKPRHPEWNFSLRLVPGHNPTQNEIEAKKIDEGDYRGTAGSAYFDLDGDIAVLSSGGGVSLTAMDALIAAGGKPANFTEYSGNPPKEKVVKLTKIVLSKPNIHGLWVIGTVAANFTDIYETLLGLIEGLREAEKELGKKFDFPIVIRRGGPREKEAFEMLKVVTDFNLILQREEVSISNSAKVMTDKAQEYAVK
jgi:citryl-CoA synthetase large subunit